ncbi:hypothetical protein BC938DRAFT_472689 [Jimgerdemannia flammicorona]|uniref:Signal transduction histidine kinase dimerisation/phosphoacceptor domain-containing protein n=1 Tax=Jimgerdemannia flammicorona TaxID=994334 RepID=A0A433Q5J8_9FUNG|nr:hypothetical protein BC938DRAFT_472689 [Jimgerdemannia flammicorona]
MAPVAPLLNNIIPEPQMKGMDNSNNNTSSPSREAFINGYRDIYHLRLANAKLNLLLEEQRKELEHLRKLLISKGVAQQELSPSSSSSSNKSLKRSFDHDRRSDNIVECFAAATLHKRQKSADTVTSAKENDVSLVSSPMSEVEMTDVRDSSLPYPESCESHPRPLQLCQTEILESIIDCVDESCIIFNADLSKALYVTERAHDLVFGSGTAAQILESPSNWVKWVHPKDLEQLMKRAIDIAQGPVSSRNRWQFNFHITKPDGTVHLISAFARTFYRNPGAPPSPFDSIGESSVFHAFFSHEIEDTSLNNSPISIPNSIPNPIPNPVPNPVRQHHEAIVQALPPNAVVLILDRHGICLEYLPSPGLWKFTAGKYGRKGRGATECLCLPISETDQRHALITAVKQALAMDQMQVTKLTIDYITEHGHAPPAGSRRWHFETRIACIDRESVVCVVRDETALVVGQEKLSQLNEKDKKMTVAHEITQFTHRRIYNVSHDFRTPLNGVLGMTTLLMHTEIDEEQRDYLESIRSSAMQLMQAMNDILEQTEARWGSA